MKSINFKEGENVKKGDLLFVIDPRPYEAALASAEAELAEAKARVELVKTNLERMRRGQDMLNMMGAISKKLYEELPEASTFILTPPAVRGIGVGGDFRVQVQDRVGLGVRAVEKYTNIMAKKATESEPILNAFTTFKVSSPQLYVDIDRVRALVQASYNFYCNLMLSIHARIASEYFFARQCESEIKLLSDTLKVRKIQTEFVQKRLSLKFASKLDLSRAKVLEYEAASQLDYVKRQLDAAKNHIALLCGRSATDFELKCAPLTDSLPNIPKVFPSQLLERRPDIAAAERNVYAANAQLGADTAAFFPTISITGDVGFKANRIENLLEAGSLAWGISPQLYIPIFQAGKLCAQKDADIAAHKEATEKYKSTVLGAIEEVETLLSDISHMNREYENRRQTSAHSADVQMYTQKQYEFGDQDYFAVSDAQRQYLTYKREEIRLLGARYRSYVSLVMSLGGGWENKYENPSAFELVNL